MSLHTHRPRQPRSPLATHAPHRIIEKEPIPFQPRGAAPYHLSLSDIVPPAVIERIKAGAQHGLFETALDQFFVVNQKNCCHSSSISLSNCKCDPSIGLKLLDFARRVGQDLHAGGVLEHRLT